MKDGEVISVNTFVQTKRGRLWKNAWLYINSLHFVTYTREDYPCSSL